MSIASKLTSDGWDFGHCNYSNVTDEVAAGLQKLRTDDTLSDFTLVTGSKEWKVHKLVLFMHSDVLYRMSTSEGFEESKTGRAELKHIDGNPFDAECIGALVRYMYDQELFAPWIPEGHCQHSVGCRGWQETSEEKDEEVAAITEVIDSDDSPVFPPTNEEEEAAETAAPTVHGDCIAHPTEGLDFLISMADLAQMYNIQPLKVVAERHVICYQECKKPGKLDAVIERICTTSTVPDTLREAMVNVAAGHIGSFYKTQTLEDFPEFADEVFKKLIKEDHRRIKREKKEAADRLRARQASVDAGGWGAWGGND